jgi:predicted AAA+ superfamily ATPase
MHRDIYQKLINWKSSKNHKPLLLQGARQTGKTYILKEFGNKEYKNLVYCNFEEEPQLTDIFARDLRPFRIIEHLSLYKKVRIDPEATLLFFDEIQASNNALNSLKYFCEEEPRYDIVAAGSLIGVKLSVPKSFPVGKVTMFSLYPLSFPEFLTAMGEDRYRSYLEGLTVPEPLPAPVHDDLISLLKAYYFVGGMPEAVALYAETRSYDRVRELQNDIVKEYLLDFAKHAPVHDIPRLSIVWDSIPLHLARENKKFVFSAISKSARGREYENALRWLSDAGLVHIAHAVDSVRQPLAGHAQRNAFKVYLFDVGLLACLGRIAPDILVNGNEMFTTYHGAFAENYAAQQFAASGRPLYYWKREGKVAEVDFLYEHGATILPLEVKAGINPKSKSLQSYNAQYSPPVMLRSSLLNLKKDGQILNVPLYCLYFVDRFL